MKEKLFGIARLSGRRIARTLPQRGFTMKKVLIGGFSALALAFLTAGCSTFTNYLQIITPHTAADLLADNVQVFEGRSYDEAAVLAAEAGYEVILSYEGRGQQGLFAVNASVRLIAQDRDGIRPGSK
jgi:rhodanese-related sulfurtransferase